MRITVENHGPDEATIDRAADAVVPQHAGGGTPSQPVPVLTLDGDGGRGRAPPARLGTGSRPPRVPTAPRRARLFCDNETNTARCSAARRSRRTRRTASTTTSSRGRPRSTRTHRGTKAAWWYRLTVPAGATGELRLRLHRPAERPCRIRRGRARTSTTTSWPSAGARPTSSTPRSLLPASTTNACGCCARPAPGWSGASRTTPTTSAGGWTATPGSPHRPRHDTGRNSGWRHLDAFDVLAMPDPWEYPWFAAWDLAFHAVPWAHLDPAFAKYQLLVLLPRVVPAPERRAAGVRVELRRRQPAGPRPGRDPGLRHRRRPPTPSSWSGSSRSCCSTSRGG